MAKGEFLTDAVVVCIGVGHFTGKQRQVALLTECEEGGADDGSEDTYVGIVHLESDFFQEYFEHVGKGQFKNLGQKATGCVPLRIEGLRRYPYAARPDYAFQFVLKGEDTAPLRAIMQRNADAAQSGVPTGQEPVHEVVEDDQAPAWQRLGFKNEEKWRKAGSPEQ